MIMDEVPDKEASFEVISKTVSAIQAIISQGREAKGIKFPKELELTGADKTETPAAISSETEQENTGTAPDTVAEAPSAAETSDAESYTLSDPELAADFISEAREHLHDTEVQLLTLENEPKDEDALGAVYRAFHTIKGVAGFLALEEVAKLAHQTESLLDLARKGDILLAGPAMDVTFESVDALKQMIDDVEQALSTGQVISRAELLSKLLPTIESAASGSEEAPVAEETGVEVSSAPAEEILGEVLETAIAAPEEPEEVEIETATAAAPQDRQAAKTPSVATHIKETLKIDAERLDKLVDTIGELVIAESMVSQDSDILDKASPRVMRNLSHLNKITRELQELGMSLRMMPVKSVFERMARLARDVSKKAGKKINFTMSGKETEVDKSIVERISDPLTHMIRNAVDHGIESSVDDRLKAGKPEAGQIELRAFHKGGNIHIEVEDDGKGLDKKAILAKARERGMIANGDNMSDQEIYNLIFAPGFSTAKNVTDVSGRGVGMDVVTQNIQALRGQVEIISVPGDGTTFSIRLPLTLAIIDGIIVRIGTERYVLPTLSVVESVRPTQEEIPTVLNRGEMISIRGKLLPLFRISELFGIQGAVEDPTEALVVVVEDEGERTGLLVDDLIGHQQIVIKNLGESTGNITGISGGAIMADGKVGLILDIAGIIKLTTGTGDMFS
jgi:two-component system chemotaxis sensor kinase CheA